jgi:TonB family protein
LHRPSAISVPFPRCAPPNVRRLPDNKQTVDDRGVPTKCTITKASGYLVLDEAVCRAAMRARFVPRTINGRAVLGIYRDAFTFRSSDDP